MSIDFYFFSSCFQTHEGWRRKFVDLCFFFFCQHRHNVDFKLYFTYDANVCKVDGWKYLTLYLFTQTDAFRYNFTAENLHPSPTSESHFTTNSPAGTLNYGVEYCHSFSAWNTFLACSASIMCILRILHWPKNVGGMKSKLICWVVFFPWKR